MLALALSAVLQASTVPPAVFLPRADRFGDGAPFSRYLPAETSRANRASLTAREGQDFGYRFDLPRGRYRVTIGFTEFSKKEAGERRFSVLLGENGVVAGIDLVREAGPAPSCLKREFDADVSGDGLELRVLAEESQATLSWIRILGEDVDLFVDCGGDLDAPARAETAPLGEVILARLGSRSFLDLRPQWDELEASPLGKFAETPRPAILGFMTDAGRFSLPITSVDSGFQPFEKIRERRTITGVQYHVEFGGLAGTITLRAPFHPGDLGLSSLPVYHVQFEVHRQYSDSPKEARATVFLPLYDATGRLVQPEAGDFRGVVVAKEIDGTPTERGLFVGTPGVDTAATRDADVQLVEYGAWVTVPLPMWYQDSSRADVLVVSYVGTPVLAVGGVEHRFAYARRLDSIEAVARHAATRRDEALAAATVVDSLESAAVLPTGVHRLMVDSIPSFLLNTYLTESDAGERWYSCLEGYCRYHSTIDVEYHAAPFYFWFAPGLLRTLLDTWPNYRREGFLCHDMGIDSVVGNQAYPHDMPVEENVNYVLLLHQYWTRTGDEAFAVARFDVVSDLLEYVLSSDRDGDGFAEEGTANTIDDASPAVQYSREQTYLGVKCAAAFVAGAELARAAGAAELAVRFAAQAERIRATLERTAWLDDHYAVCIDQDAAGLADPWTGEPLAVPTGSGRLEGWDAAHPYTSQGLLYLMRAGLDLPVDTARLRLDMRTAAVRCGRRFGSAHSDLEQNSWVSLNLFRDATQCYLGDDVLDRAARYAELQGVRARATDMRDWAGFCDSAHNRMLSYYPRGVAVLALVEAAAGVVLDRRAGRLFFRPVRAPLRVPLPELADWKTLRVPWFEVGITGDGTPRAWLTEEDLLAGLDVSIDLSLVGGE